MNIKQILEHPFFIAVDKISDKIYNFLLFLVWCSALPLLLVLGVGERIIKKVLQ